MESFKSGFSSVISIRILEFQPAFCDIGLNSKFLKVWKKFPDDPGKIELGVCVSFYGVQYHKPKGFPSNGDYKIWFDLHMFAIQLIKTSI